MIKKYPDFWSVILGSGSVGSFLGYLVLAYLGAIAAIVITVAYRDKNSPNTPQQWSWRFFWINNSLRFAAGFFLIPLFIRLIYEDKTPGLMVWMSIGIGFGFQYLAYVAKGIGLFTANALSKNVMEKLQVKQQEANDQNQPKQ